MINACMGLYQSYSIRQGVILLRANPRKSVLNQQLSLVASPNGSMQAKILVRGHDTQTVQWTFLMRKLTPLGPSNSAAYLGVNQVADRYMPRVWGTTEIRMAEIQVEVNDLRYR